MNDADGAVADPGPRPGPVRRGASRMPDGGAVRTYARLRNRLAAALLVAALLVASAAAANATETVGAPGAPRQSVAGARAPVGHVIVVGIAGLRWSDVTEADAPTLAGLTRSGSAGTLSVRSAAGVTCPAEGWLTLGAGSYAAAVDLSDLDPADGCGPRRSPPVTTGDPAVPTMPALRDLNDTPRLGARPGTLAAGVDCASAVGRGAALAAADPAGSLTHYAPALPTDPAELLTRCPLTVVDLGAIDGAGEARRAEVRRLDRQLTRIHAHRPAGSVLLLLGVAETDARQPRLHVAMGHGPGFGPGWLRSPSTRRLPYVQLVDVAPTVLATLGRPVPDQVPGRPLTGGAPGRPDSLAETVAVLADTDTQAVTQRATMGRFFAGLAVVLLLLVASAGWLLRRHRHRPGHGETVTRWLSMAAFGLSAVPAATFVANLTPWWRSPAPASTVAVVVAAVAAAMTAVALWISRRSPRWRDRVRSRLATLAVLTLLVFALDAGFGGQLQLNSLLGYNPLVAGRFTGFGNIAFAVFAVAGVFAAALLAHGHPRRTALRRVAAVAVPVIVIDGLPSLGADFGGVLALVPVFVLLGLLVARARVTWTRLVAAGVGGAALVLTIAWLDYLRPTSERSHFGRFVGSILDGTAWQTVHRKLLTSVELLFMGPHTLLGGLLVLIGTVLLFRPPEAVRGVYAAWPMVRAGLVCVAAAAGLGFAANDSGVAIPVVMGLVVLPTTVALCVWLRVGDPWRPPVDDDSRPTARQPAVAGAPAQR